MAKHIKKGSSAKGGSVKFVSKKSMSYETTGPSGKTYQFYKDVGVIVTDNLDIASFMSNPHLKIFGAVSEDRKPIIRKKPTSPESFKIKKLLTEDQLDYMNNTGRM